MFASMPDIFRRSHFHFQPRLQRVALDDVAWFGARVCLQCLDAFFYRVGEKGDRDDDCL